MYVIEHESIKKSNVFDLTKTVEPSTWSIKQNKDDVFSKRQSVQYTESGVPKIRFTWFSVPNVNCAMNHIFHIFSNFNSLNE